MRWAMRVVPVLFVALIEPRTAGAWGVQVHALVNRSATTHLPVEFAAFAQWADSLEGLSVEADARRCCDPNEAIRHYIDIDDYDEFFSRTLPRTYPEMVARFGRDRVDSNGILPWTIESGLAQLTQHFRDHDWPRAVAVAADLGHYVADGHQPFHLTLNHDGQLTGQRGIHSRYESVLTEIYLRELAIQPGRASAYFRPVDAVFEWIERIYPGVRLVLAADHRAKRAAGGDTGNQVYYEVLWRETGAETQLWLRQASLAVASMWLTAWFDAGSPPLPGSAPTAVAAGGLQLFPNGPNPFSAWTTLRFRVEEPGTATLRVYDVHGRIVRTLLETDPGRGERNLSWNGRDDQGRLVASGIYKVRLEQRARAVERSAVLVR